MKLSISVLELLVGLIVLSSAGLIVAGISYSPVGQDAAMYYASTEAEGVNRFFVDTGIYSRAIYSATMAGDLTAQGIGMAVEKQFNATMEKIKENSQVWNSEPTKELRRRLSMCKIVVEYNGQTFSFNLNDVFNLYDGDNEGKQLGYYPDNLDINKATVVASNSVAFTTITNQPVIFRVYYIVPK